MSDKINQPCYQACGTARSYGGKGSGMTCGEAHPRDYRCFGPEDRHAATGECADAGRCQHPAVEARAYPCDDCGKLRTKAEGGTTFTVCDDCWNKHHHQGWSKDAHPAPAAPSATHTTGDGRAYERSSDGVLRAPAAPVAEPGLLTFEKGFVKACEAVSGEWLIRAGGRGWEPFMGASALWTPRELKNAEYKPKPAPPPAPKLSRVREMAEGWTISVGVKCECISFGHEVARDVVRFLRDMPDDKSAGEWFADLVEAEYLGKPGSR